jgi:hypothetical protein
VTGGGAEAGAAGSWAAEAGKRQYNCAQGGRGKGCCGDGFSSGTAQTDPWVPKEAGGARNWTKVPHWL